MHVFLAGAQGGQVRAELRVLGARVVASRFFWSERRFVRHTECALQAPLGARLGWSCQKRHARRAG